tara:strand:- start:387621 stop:388055 length:435 start_codon:yes stop_codon:yes gene_type:complete
MSENCQPRNWRRIGLTAVMIMASAIIAVLWIRSNNRDTRFDAVQWKDEARSLEDSDIRLRMINDLQRNVLQRGMTRVEIESLLGKHQSGFFNDEYDLVYRLGSESDTAAITRHGAVIRSRGLQQWLALKLNDRGQLVEWTVVKR